MVAAAFELNLRTRQIPWLLAKAIATLAEGTALLTQGAEPLLTRYGAGILAFSQTLDISAISGDLGYSPNISIEEGLHLHAEWWRANQSAHTASQST
jgi:nucleoside-diphosphate-sugar epimerase